MIEAKMTIEEMLKYSCNKCGGLITRDIKEHRKKCTSTLIQDFANKIADEIDKNILDEVYKETTK